MSFLNSLNSRRGLKSRSRRNKSCSLIVSAEVLEKRELLTAAVPAMESLPGAAITVYLDFDGHFEQQWGTTTVYTDVVTPAFDIDGNPNDFNAQEVAIITEAWQTVAEDFSPFDVNISTVAPAPGQDAIRVAIGGLSHDWLLDATEEAEGGIAVRESFYKNDHVNTVYVFANDLLGGNTFPSGRNIADATSHETGHSLGLKHQSLFDDNDINTQNLNKLEEYHSGNSLVAPIMGNSYEAERSVWWIGLDTDAWRQDDAVLMYEKTVLQSPDGPFRFLADDYANTIPSQPMIPINGPFTAKGIISPMKVQNGAPAVGADYDYFFVSLGIGSGTGQWTATVNNAEVGANLDVRIEVYDESGNFIAAADPSDSLDASMNLGIGNYWIAVMGHNRIGHMDPGTSHFDMGQYTLSVTSQQLYWELIPELYMDYDMGDPWRAIDKLGDPIFRDRTITFDLDTKSETSLLDRDVQFEFDTTKSDYRTVSLTLDESAESTTKSDDQLSKEQELQSDENSLSKEDDSKYEMETVDTRGIDSLFESLSDPKSQLRTF